mgnify:FL=1
MADHCAQANIAHRSYVVREGEALVSDTERARVPVEFARNLLEMRDKYVLASVTLVAFIVGSAHPRGLRAQVR